LVLSPPSIIHYFPEKGCLTHANTEGLNGVEAYRHALWKDWDRIDFTTASSRHEIRRETYGTDDIRYTGRTHVVEGETFYEIDVKWYDYDSGEETENPLTELVEEILREAENLLRENHGLPRIGEGWVSETQLYYLVKDRFPDAQQHSSPDWLKPQHLDVFVPSRHIAFEYQGRQHFEPVEFFGGIEAFERTRKRDERKREKCELSGVWLICWRYDEPIHSETLSGKLRQANIET
jgi:hypothetical protein